MIFPLRDATSQNVLALRIFLFLTLTRQILFDSLVYSKIFLYFFDPKSVWKIHPFNWQCIGLFSDDINLVIFLAITDNLQSSSCGQFSGNYVYCQSRVLSWTREASTGQSEKAGAPKTKSVASPPSIHRMIPSSGCPCSFPLLTLTGYNVVSCQDLKAHTNTAGSDMFW